MLFSISDQLEILREKDFPKMPQQELSNIATIFPDWFKDIIMLSIAMIASGVVSIAKSKYAGVFVFSVWITNIFLSMVIAFLVDSIALWIQPDLNIKAEMALMVITGILAKDILEIAEKKGLAWIEWKSGK